MCKNLNPDQSCILKSTLPDGRRYDPHIAMEINSAFKTIAEQRDINGESKLGYGCGGSKCCYLFNKLVNTKDFPYFDNSVKDY